MSNQIAFVASTLPLHWLSQNIRNNGIREIVVASGELHNSYKILCNNHKELVLSVVPKNKAAGILFVFNKVLFCKLTSSKIFFFHECCWVILDLVIKLLRPRGEYFPQVSMDSFELVDRKNKNLNSLINIFSFFDEHDNFKISFLLKNCKIQFSLKYIN